MDARVGSSLMEVGIENDVGIVGKRLTLQDTGAMGFNFWTF